GNRRTSSPEASMRNTERTSIIGLAGAFSAWSLQASPRWSPTNIFAPASTPADAIFGLSVFVLSICAAIFVVVFSLLVYTAVRFRKRPGDDSREPAQIYGSKQVELAWTVIPVLIVAILFLTVTRVIVRVQGASRPPGALEVTVIGHQYWWEYRYPDL